MYQNIDLFCSKFLSPQLLMLMYTLSRNGELIRTLLALPTETPYAITINGCQFIRPQSG